MNQYDWQLRPISEARTRAGPPTELMFFPHLSRCLSAELLMFMLQHWRLRTNKPQTAKINTGATNSDLKPRTLLSAPESKISQAHSGFSSATLFIPLIS